jgi:hypothetical protein
MPSYTYTAKLADKDLTIAKERLYAFRDLYVSDSELAARMSRLFWFHIFVLDKEFGISPHEILHTIGNLEKGEPPSGIKPATQFRRMPLKGLWHKHYFSARFLPQNILLALSKNGFEDLLKEVIDPSQLSAAKQMIEELARRVAEEPAEERAAANKLTGEWVVFIEHDGKNYYLACPTHDVGDEALFNAIMKHCVRDFPKLADWVKAAQA